MRCATSDRSRRITHKYGTIRYPYRHPDKTLASRPSATTAFAYRMGAVLRTAERPPYTHSPALPSLCDTCLRHSRPCTTPRTTAALWRPRRDSPEQPGERFTTPPRRPAGGRSGPVPHAPRTPPRLSAAPCSRALNPIYMCESAHQASPSSSSSFCPNRRRATIGVRATVGGKRMGEAALWTA